MRGRMTVRNRLSLRIIQCTQIVLNICITPGVAAATKSSAASGEWNNPASWSPAGVPTAGDDVYVLANHSISFPNDIIVRNLVVASGGKLTGTADKLLTVSGNLTVNGVFDMAGCNIDMTSSNPHLILGAGSEFYWTPGNNTAAGTKLFEACTEDFDPSSTLIIRTWYDYAHPLSEFMSGNYGNLVINTPQGNGMIAEWNQKNLFEQHLISGTLTIDQGWVTLDKSGAIRSTAIGKIVLTSMNSVFVCHEGNHPSSFTLTTNSVTNNGGRFYGLNDGNGNISLIVNGHFKNTGNVKIINNTGIPGVSNGNATIRIEGNFIQDSGDTRFIYNVTTTNSGLFHASVRNLVLNGGIFMGQSGCHTGNNKNIFDISENLTINFSRTTDKFRGNGITSIGPVVNNAGIEINIGGTLSIEGNSLAEFTTSTSSGSELMTVGNATIKGCTANFNYGTSQASHTCRLKIPGNLSIAGGTTYLSRNNGSLHAEIGGDLVFQSGMLILKGNKGQAIATISGNYFQTGGELRLHSNSTTPTPDVVSLLVNGAFIQQSGKINYDNNGNGAEHVISIRGSSCSFGPGGSITCENGNSTNYGILKYETPGTIKYSKNGLSHSIYHVVQIVDENCELAVSNTNLLIASTGSKDFPTLRIAKGGRITLRNSFINSGQSESFSNLLVENGAVLSLNNSDGFAGSTNSAIATGIDYILQKFSIIEYIGTAQKISGQLQNDSKAEHTYGILRINLFDDQSIADLRENVVARGGLQLIRGAINLNNKMITIENGSSAAIFRKNGFILSRQFNGETFNKICWKSVAAGEYEFPFGRSTSQYIPVKINVLSGFGRDITISTFKTVRNSPPYPVVPLSDADGETIIKQEVVDRYWSIQAEGITADVTFSFCDDESKSISESDINSLSALWWNNNTWKLLPASSRMKSSQSRCVKLRHVSGFSEFILATNIEEGKSETRSSFSGMHPSGKKVQILSVSPNPFQTSLSIRYGAKTNVKIEIVDMNGRKVRSANIFGGDDQWYTFHELDNLKAGNYILMITGDGISDSKKIIKNE